MPLYEYKCTKCGSVFEVIQKVDDPPIKKCLKCGAAVHKIISPPALQFKGSGWYITDYANKGKKSAPPKSPKPLPDKKTDSPAKTDRDKEKTPEASSTK